MVNSCCVVGCRNRANDKIKRRFFVFPRIRTHQTNETRESTERRRNKWITRVNRKDFSPSPHTRICSDHFVTGKPANYYDETHPDWAPSLKLSPEVDLPVKKSSLERYQRVKDRTEQAKKILQNLEGGTCSQLSDISAMDVDVIDRSPSVQVSTTGCSFIQLGPCRPEVADNSVTSVVTPQFRDEYQRLLSENMLLKKQLEDLKISEAAFSGNDKKVTYYTGLPGFTTLMAVFGLIEPFLMDSTRTNLSKFQKMMIVMMKLRLGLPVTDLAYRFGVCPATISRTFLTVLHILYMRLEGFVFWPDREELRKTMPMSFRKHFGVKVAVVIDCFEIFIQSPSNLLARAETFSSYKHHNTVKFLIGITPQGVISYISKAYGGRCSDKFITNDCGFLNKLNPGDVVLADRGFDIQESVGLMCAEVMIPNFTRGKSQLSAYAVERTRKIANVRIHVERVIGLLRNKYTILTETLPIDFLGKKHPIDIPTVDKMVTVCCALTNFCESVIPFN